MPTIHHAMSDALDDLAGRCRDELRKVNLAATARTVGVHVQHLRKFRDGSAGLSPQNLDRLAQELSISTVTTIEKNLKKIDEGA